MRIVRLAAVLSLLLAVAGPAAAQVVQGRVREADGSPAPQVLLVLLDAQGRRAGAAMSDAEGHFALRASSTGRMTLRAERVGYAATVSDPFDVPPAGTVEKGITMDGRRVALEGIVATGAARSCAVRPGTGVQTAVVWDEARKALASAAYGQQHRLAQFRIGRWRRELNTSGGVLRRTRTDTTATAALPFASLPAAQLSASGWIQVTAEGTMYYGPDPAVLVSDEFLDDHCLRVAERDRAAGDSLIGLAFEPVGGRRAPDVRGVLWLNRSTAELRRVDYTYTGLPDYVAGPLVGGRVEYARTGDGRWIVSRWAIRMPQVLVAQGWRTTPGEDVFQAYRGTRVVGIREDGGEVLEVLGAPAGPALASAPPSVVEGTAWDSARAAPLAGARVFVSGTALETVTDSAGHFLIETGGPGTWTLAVAPAEPVLVPARPATVTVGAGQTARVELATPGVATLAAALCPPSADPATGAVVGTVQGPSPAGTAVRATWTERGRGTRSLQATADGSGIYALCGVPRDRGVVVSATRGGMGAQAAVALEGRPAARQDLSLAAGQTGMIAAASSSSGSAVPLRPITATGRRAYADFERRRASGRGVFLTRAQIVAKHPLHTVDIFQGIPGVRLMDDGRGGQKVQMAGATAPIVYSELPHNVGAARTVSAGPSGKGGVPMGSQGSQATNEEIQDHPVSGRAGVGDCQVQYYVDGARFLPTHEGDISTDIQPSQIESIEVYRNAAETPPEFRDQDAACGTVVIWLRRGTGGP